MRAYSICGTLYAFSCKGILRTLSLGHHKHCTCMPHYMTLCIDGLHCCFLFPYAHNFLCVLDKLHSLFMLDKQQVKDTLM